MARSTALLILAVLVAAACVAHLGSAARNVPAEQSAEAVEWPERVQEGTVLIPGIGRYELGSHYMPDILDVDHSISAAANGQFLPGADDTWIPNPGFEVPNPFQPDLSTP